MENNKLTEKEMLLKVVELAESFEGYDLQQVKSILNSVEKAISVSGPILKIDPRRVAKWQFALDWDKL